MFGLQKGADKSDNRTKRTGKVQPYCIKSLKQSGCKATAEKHTRQFKLSGKRSSLEILLYPQCASILKQSSVGSSHLALCTLEK